MAQGCNVLVHCYAGAHRAGATVVSWLLYKEDFTLQKAVHLAMSRRSVIQIIAEYPSVLHRLFLTLQNP